MAETVGTTKLFDLPIDEIIEQALEGLGGEHVSQYEAKLARRALNLLFIDMQNRGMVPLASMEQIVVPLTSGSSLGYPMGTSVINILDAVIRTSTSTQTIDTPIERISLQDWLDIPVKDSPGRPTQFMVDAQRDQLLINFWQVPNNATFKFVAWSCTKVADVTSSYQLVDFTSRYLPSIVYGLRWKMAEIRQLDRDSVMYYKSEYLESLDLAMSEDRERVDYAVHPYSRTQLGS